MTQDAFIQLCQGLSDHIWLQGVLVAVGTCLLEDAARCGIGLLVAAEQVGWWVAFVGMTVGGIAGDIVLYLIGRYAALFLLKWRWVDAGRLERTERYFERQAVKTVLIARFLPGVRTVVYVSAGAIKYPLPRFTALLIVASLVQSAVFIELGVFIGERLLPHLHDPRMKVATIALVVLALVAGHILLGRRNRRRGALGDAA